MMEKILSRTTTSHGLTAPWARTLDKCRMENYMEKGFTYGLMIVSSLVTNTMVTGVITK